VSDTSFAYLQSRCIDVPDALHACSEEPAQTVTHHMCTFIVMGFSMDAAKSHSVTETGEKGCRRCCGRREMRGWARLRSDTVRIWYATEHPIVIAVHVSPARFAAMPAARRAMKA
jgi:hypothetical protein